MKKVKKEFDDKNQISKSEEIKSSDIENANASGDGSLGREKEATINNTIEDNNGAREKNNEQY